MNAVDLAKRAYGGHANPVRTPRTTEYALFARITKRLRVASGRGRQDFGQLAQALHENRQLWATLASDVAGSGNRLPKDLRGRIFYLSEFVAAHSRRVLKGDANVDALVDVNTAMMRGLGEEGRGQ